MSQKRKRRCPNFASKNPKAPSTRRTLEGSEGNQTPEFTPAATSAIIEKFPVISAPLAQLDRASGYEPEGREFDSLRAHHNFNNLGHPASGALGFVREKTVIRFEAIATTFCFAAQDSSESSGEPFEGRVSETMRNDGNGRTSAAPTSGLSLRHYFRLCRFKLYLIDHSKGPKLTLSKARS